jgi:predicted transposase/invertase (TIGR01784 family)
MANTSNNLHDKFVKEMFADKGMAVAFLDAFLPADVRVLLKLEEMTYVKDSFVTDELREIFSDVIMQCPTTSSTAEPVLITILIEHKSYPDKWVNLQILGYLAQAYLRQIRNKQPFHPIIPVIYYQGQQPWTPQSIRELASDFPDPLLPYLPDFQAVCVTLMSLNQNNLDFLRHQLLISSMLAQRHRFDPIRLREDLIRILKTFPPHEKYGNLMKSIVVYVLAVSEVTEEEIVSAIQQLPTPLKSNVMTTYDLITTRARKEGFEKGIETGIEKGIAKGIEKGIEKGKIEGKLEGKIEGKIETILNAHVKGLDLALIANITAMSEEEVTRILKEHGRLD